ncbi:MAG: DMT family transporter, partial [Aggregatilineales bacterium]
MSDSQSIKLNPTGIVAAFAAPVFLGMAPIFGKMAIQGGADAFTVAALRTVLAVLMLWLIYGLFLRRYIFIYPAGLLGCIVIGAINGIGSLFYYGGLELLDASLVQLINGSYLAFALLLSRIGGQRISPRTMLRVTLAMVALVMITGFSAGDINWAGVGLMLANALMFAGTVILSQYVLYEMPAFTATLYILTTMAVVVTMVWLAVSPPLTAQVFEATIVPIALLAVTTALSRLAIFAGVKFLGGMQTAILGILEIAVALILAALFLNETLTTGQWAGTFLLFMTMLLIRQQDLHPRGVNPNFLIVANMSSVQFQRIAFHRAFGTGETDNEEGTMGNVTTQEMIAIQKMMGAHSGGIDPFPIGATRKFATEQ